MENKLTIESAKQFLKDHGYYVDNLWHIDDVKQKQNMSDEEAYDILGKSLESTFIMENIFEQIILEISFLNL
jgi:hypothetical protein